MIEMLKELQPDLMLALIGIGVAFAVLVVLSKALSPKRRLVIAIVELTASLLLCCERLSYLYDGVSGDIGYWGVWITNFMAFILIPISTFIFDHYIMNLFREDLDLKIPKRLWIVCGLSLVDTLLVAAGSMFDGFLFSINELNEYSRGPAFYLCYIIPVLTTVLMLWVVIQHRKHFSKTIFLSLLLFLLGPDVFSILQAFTYGFSLGDLAIMVTSLLIYIFAYLDINDKVENANRSKIMHLEEQQRLARRLFEQTATALANAIDAKDEYTRGHSLRVAEYSEKIAKHMGKSPEECQMIYYAGLLHDVGKIGVPDHIITKNGRLTEEEYDQIKQHPVTGNQILSSIWDYPYLSVGAHYHHERYDGKGYPEHKKGEEIPEVARIISVADAYDAMTSTRSYRAAIPQQIVREEIVKNAGTQFDPEMAKIMQHLIDLDSQYLMKERNEAHELKVDQTLENPEFGTEISEGIHISPEEVTIRFLCESEPGAGEEDLYPSMILFDSLDAMFHKDERDAKNLFCFEYGHIRMDGTITCLGARKIEPLAGSEAPSALTSADSVKPRTREYMIKAFRVKDHAKITIDDGTTSRSIIVAFPDSTRYAYIGLTGSKCTIYDVKIERSETSAKAGDIPRIAEEISYIRENEGDIPNVQIDNFRSDVSKGTLITDGMQMTFHSMSLPTARLIWHCPYIVLFHSDNGEVNGPGYREYALIRLDGEYWDGVDVKNTSSISKEGFEGWDQWKAENKKGIDVTVDFSCIENGIIVKTANLGIALENTTKIGGGKGVVYVALSGDQCAITNIRIKK